MENCYSNIISSSAARSYPNKDGGSFAAAFCVNLQPTDKNNWVYVYPLRETDYNDAFKANPNPEKTEK